jgi:hypothetical protein
LTVQIAAEAADAEEHEIKGLDTDTLVLGEVPAAMEFDAEPQVKCHNELVWVLLSWL